MIITVFGHCVWTLCLDAVFGRGLDVTTSDTFRLSTCIPGPVLLSQQLWPQYSTYSPCLCRSYLGLSYQALHHDVGMYTNHFMLMRPDGGIAWNYLKAYPVRLLA